MNIVTIDFDIIMGPSIGVYNNAVNEDFKVDSIIEDYPFLSNVPADLNIYEYLTRYIVDVIKVLPQDKIQFIRSHEQIVPLVSKYRDANLINIDHHHDIGYEIEDWTKPIVGKPQCGNWVKKLFDTKVINHYDWVSNPLSDVLPDEVTELYAVEDHLLKDYSLINLTKNTDVLIICQSFEWVPRMYQPLFYTWVGIYEEMTDRKYTLID